MSHVEKSLWAGITFSDLDDLNPQARGWCERINSRVHRTTHGRPIDRLGEEQLRPLPQDVARERFATEERTLTWALWVARKADPGEHIRSRARTQGNAHHLVGRHSGRCYREASSFPEEGSSS